MTDGISKNLRDNIRKWTNIIEENIGKIRYVREESLGNLISEMREFVKEDNITVIFYNDAKLEPCPKCNYECGRIYQWLGLWYVMCISCGHGIPDPVLVDWGKYGELNKEEKK